MSFEQKQKANPFAAPASKGISPFLKKGPSAATPDTSGVEQAKADLAAAEREQADKDEREREEAIAEYRSKNAAKDSGGGGPWGSCTC